MAIHDEPLFNERIEAWQHGPVIPAVWHEYKVYGSYGIPAPGDLDDELYDAKTKKLLDEVWDVYGQFSAWKLRNMTHEETPWIEAWASPDKTISNASLKRYFETLVED